MNESEYRLEQSRKIKRDAQRQICITDNGLWWIQVNKIHKDGAFYRKGFVRRKREDAWKAYASFGYGDHEDMIAFQGQKLPEYVKEICIDLGIELKRLSPLLGIDFVDPDYVLEEV